MLKCLILFISLSSFSMAHISTSSILSFPVYKGAIILLDVDDTLITPISAFFHHYPYKKTLDNLKAEHHPDLPRVLGNWRLQRKVQLLNESWPVTIQKWQEQGATVLALTQLHSGAYGPIPSMEEWRYQELASLGIRFSTPLQIPEPITLLSSDGGNATFYNGILITGPFSKAETFAALLKYVQLTISQVIFFDDRMSHLDALKEWSHQQSIPFQGYHFTGLELLDTTLDIKIAEWQKDQLLKNYTWFEDQDVREKMFGE